nr:antirestriction protein [uncultured Rhodoferax sp.]
MAFISTITRKVVPESERMAFVARLLGNQYVLQFEPTVFRFAEQLSSQYSGGYWQFYTISNGAFYMALQSDTNVAVSCENGFQGSISTDAFGIAACLYAYCHLSFGAGPLAETCASQYHLLREYMFEHAEARAILAAID